MNGGFTNSMALVSGIKAISFAVNYEELFFTYINLT